MTLRIREAQLDDAPAIAALAGVLGYAVEPEEMGNRLSRVLARGEDTVLVAASGADELAGWLHGARHTLLTSPLTCEILALVVSARHRRLGVARGLVTTLESWARSHGVTTLTVRSNIVRLESHAFYASLGYDRIKTQHVYRKPLT